MHRRRILKGAALAGLVACTPRAKTGDAIAPEELPAPPPTSPPQGVLVLVGPGVLLRLLLPVHAERMAAGPLSPVRLVSEAGAEAAPEETAMVYGAGDEEPPQGPEVRRVGDGAWVELDPQTELSRFGEAAPAPKDHAAWSLGLGDARFSWPPELVADAFAGEVPRVELRRFADPRDVMIVVRGPLSVELVPDLDALVGPGQREEARDADASPPWVEVSYVHGEDTWRQRHYRFVAASRGRIVLVTAQATTETAGRVIEDGDLVARSLFVVTPG